MRSVTRPLCAALLVASALSSSCDDKPASQLVVVFTGDVSVGNGASIKPEIGYIEISGARDNSDILAQITVGRNDGMNALPASITLYNRDDDSDPASTGSLVVKGYLDGNNTSSALLTHTLKFNLSKEEVHLLKLPMQLACFGVTCLQNKTCVDGSCVDSPTLDARGLPTYSDQIDPTKNLSSCLNVTRSGCFASARQISATALLPEQNDNSRCVLRVPAADVPAGSEEQLNLAVVWSESSNRYAVMDESLKATDPATPWREIGAGWSYARVGAVSNGYFEFKLPKGVCQHTPLNGSNRVRSFVFSAGDASCPTKTSAFEVCDHLPEDASAEKVACSTPFFAPEAFASACNSCLLAETKKPVLLAECKDDAGCKQITSCAVLCSALYPDKDCVAACTMPDNCVSQSSADTAKKLAASLSVAAVACRNECQPRPGQ